LPPVR
jgi:hypothetical protein